jgi:arylsulfatase A-like enzyme
LKRRLADLAVAAFLLGTVQAVVETGVLAWLNRSLLLAPYRFFPTHQYDAFAKLYFLAADRLPLPLMLQDFVGQGLLAKLALAPQLVAINAAAGLAVALLLAPVAGLLGVGKAGAKDSARRALTVVVATCLVVHLAVWAAEFQAPQYVTAFKLVRAIARDLMEGGAGLAIGVLFVSAAATRLALATRITRTAVAAAAVVLVSANLLSGTDVASASRNAAATTAPPSPASRYNVILISVDSLRADHLGVYGYKRATSPAMDAIAREGVVFRHHSSTTSWTLPAHMSLLTGRSLLGHGVVSDDRSLPASIGTVAEAFQKAGYQTHAIVSAPYLGSRYGFAKGFEDYDDRTIHFETNEESYHSVTAPKLLAATDEFLEQKRDRPFFLFLHFWDVHYDYAPGPPYETMFDPDYKGTMTGTNYYFDPAIHAGMDQRDLDHLVALYDGEIRLVDDHIARLRSELATLGVAGRTMIAIVGDHGDEFFEHGNKGHHRTLYEEVLHTPFLLDVPGVEPARRDVEQEVSIIDVGPTLMALAGVAAPSGPQAMEGRDFSGLYTGAAVPGPAPVHAELYRTGIRTVEVAELDSRRKVIHQFQRRRLETFDLDADAGEQRSLAPTSASAVPMVGSLRDWLDGGWHHFDRQLRTEGVSKVVLDAKTAEQLKSLGYLN